MRSVLAGMGLATLLSLGVAAGVQAQQAHTVHFHHGTTGASVTGSITGDEYIDYRLGAQAGQVMRVELTGAPYFNILAPGSQGEAIFIGSMEGSEFAGTLSVGGTYTVRIYQMGAAEDEGHTNRFTLDMGID